LLFYLIYKFYTIIFLFFYFDFHVLSQILIKIYIWLSFLLAKIIMTYTPEIYAYATTSMTSITSVGSISLLLSIVFNEKLESLMILTLKGDDKRYSI